MPPSYTRAHIQKAQSYHQAPPPRQMPKMPMPHPSFTQNTRLSPVSDDGHRNPRTGPHGWMSSAARVGAQTANTLANSTTAIRQDVAGRLAWYSLPTTAAHTGDVRRESLPARSETGLTRMPMPARAGQRDEPSVENRPASPRQRPHLPHSPPRRQERGGYPHHASRDGTMPGCMSPCSG